MNRFYNFFTKHRLVLVLASMLSFLIISPSLIFILFAGGSYRGVDIGSWADYGNYLTKGREILEGHSLGNWFLKIGKDTLSDPHQIYVEYILLEPIRLLGLSDFFVRHITELYYLYAFFGIVVLIFLIYFFISYLSGDILLATAIAIFTVGGYSLVLPFYQTPTAFGPNFNMFVRPIVPLYGLLALFIYINVLVRSLKSYKWIDFFWAGMSFGILFYIYPYTWSFAVALTASLLFIYIGLRKFEHVKKVLVIILLGLALGSHALIKTVSISFPHSDVEKQIIYEATQDVQNHAPAPFSKLTFLVLILFIIFAYRNKKDDSLPLLLAIILSGWICINQQVITGRNPQIMHYFWYFIIPISIIIGFYLAWSLLQNQFPHLIRKYGKILLVILIIIAFCTTAIKQYQGTVATFELRKYAQNYRPIFDALNNDINQGVILISDEFYGVYLTVYTHHDLFWITSALIFNTPMERKLEALYVDVYLDKEARNDFVDQLKKTDIAENTALYENRPYVPLYHFLTGYRSGLNSVDYSNGLELKSPDVLKKRDETADFLFEGYKKVAKDPQGIIDILKRDDVNYIVWDKNRNPEWDLSFLSGLLKEVVVSNNIYLYKIMW